MKGQAHIVIFSDPINWLLAPPVLYGLAGCEVQNPFPVEAWSESQIPRLDTSRICSKCLAHLEAKRKFADEDTHGDSEKLHFYVYAIGDKKLQDRHEQKHSGDTINELESAVSRVGVNHLPLKQ